MYYLKLNLVYHDPISADESTVSASISISDSSSLEFYLSGAVVSPCVHSTTVSQAFLFMVCFGHNIGFAVAML